MDKMTQDATARRRPPRSNGRYLAHAEYIASVSTPVSLTAGSSEPLYAAASELLRCPDDPAVLSAAVRQAAHLLATHISFVMLLDSSARFLKLEASVGHRTPTFTTIVRPVQAITAVGTGMPVQSSDFLNDSRLDHDPATDDIIRKEGMRTVLAVPLRHEDRMLGALYVGHREPRHFPQIEVERLLALAGHVSAALFRVQQLTELKSRLDQQSKLWRQAEAERDRFRRAEEIAHAVMYRVREHEGVTAVTVALAECLEHPLLVTDWKLAPVAQSAGRSNASASRSPISFLNRPEAREAVAACSQTHGPVAAGREWRVAPIEAGHNVLGYLWVGPLAGGDEVALIDLVMERMIPVVALELYTKGDFDRRQRGDFIYELLAERTPDFSVLEARAAHFWSHFSEAHRPLILTVNGADEQWGSRLEAARRLVAAARPNDFAAIYGRHLVLLVAPATRRHVEAAISDIQQILDRNRLTVSAVVGGECRDLKESRDSTIAALRLHELLGTNGVLWVEGLEALTQIFDPAQRERLEALRRTVLAPFGHRGGLMDALHAYYEAGGNKADAARRLSVHVNTLRQRLERVEQVVGGSVDDSIRAVPLRLALLVRNVLGES